MDGESSAGGSTIPSGDAPCTTTWWSLPRDVEHQVLVLVVGHSKRATMGTVRLVCKAWLRAVEYALEDVELYSWPCSPTYLERFVMVKRAILAGRYLLEECERSLLVLPTVKALAGMKFLRALQITYAGPGTFESVGLLTQLTSLTLHRGRDTSTADHVVLPGQLTSLTRLEELRLDGIQPDYHVLAVLPCLQRLDLQGQTVRPGGSNLWASSNPAVGLDALVPLRVLSAKGNYGLSRLPAAVGHLSLLETLDLSGNMLWALPAAMGGLGALTRLNLSSNCLSSLPEEVGKLSSLMHLDVSNNSRLQLPGSLSRLCNLEVLNLNWIWSDVHALFDHTTAFRRLTNLHLVGNGMAELPDSVSALGALHTLSLSMNHLTQLPEAIVCLTALEVLDLSDNKTRALPDGLGHLQSLTWLGVRSNALSSLPHSIGQLTNLSTLDASMNQLSSLPESITSCKSLTSLLLNFNPISALPAGFSALSCLRKLELHYVPLNAPQQAALMKLRAARPALDVLTGCLCPRRCCAIHNPDCQQLRSERSAP